MARVFRIREIRLCNPIPQSSSSCVVDEAKNIQVGDSSCIDERSPLDLRVPPRDRDHDIGYSSLELVRGDIAQFTEVGTGYLSPRERRSFAAVDDLGIVSIR